MKKILFVLLCLPLFVFGQEIKDGDIALPGEPSSVPALEFMHFPSRMHAFIWRNWTSVPVSRLAKVLNTSEKNVEKVALSLGLSKQKGILPQWNSSKGYITVLRRNWHLLPYDQLLTLLGLTRQELASRLIEDDFLFVKLGYLKPFCSPLYYEEPTKETQLRADKLASWVQELKDVMVPEVPRFDFFNEFNTEKKNIQETGNNTSFGNKLDLRLIFSYCAVFGDPLKDPTLSSYPDDLLQRLSQKGINAIWIHSVLRTLVPPEGIFPGDTDYNVRIENLNKLVARAKKYNIGVYLYMNEPRAMPDAFFNSPEREALKGVAEGSVHALCTSNKDVLNWISNSLEKVFKNVPGLAGVFTITASENLTNCASRGNKAGCERCKNRPLDEIIVNANKAIYEGVSRGNPKANVIVWDWGWDDSYAEKIISQLPKKCWLMSVSEWSLPIERGGIKSSVGEYSISSVGPGPRALSHWAYAKKAGLRTVAKIQVNSSWEIASVPSVPTMNLIAEHAQHLSNAAIDGVMYSWSVGGYPSLNLSLFQEVFNGAKSDSLLTFATRHYDKKSAPHIIKAWQYFSDGFAQYPYNGNTLYNGPQQMGPANLLYAKPTGYKATMVGIPYDDLAAWCSIYPTDIWIAQMEKVAHGFKMGCDELNKALKNANKNDRSTIQTDLNRATAIEIHFASVVSQAIFTKERNNYLSAKDDSSKQNNLHAMEACVYKEMGHVRRLLPLVLKDPTIGYESSNQYFYTPHDLVEKYINLNSILEWIKNEKDWK